MIELLFFEVLVILCLIAVVLVWQRPGASAGASAAVSRAAAPFLDAERDLAASLGVAFGAWAVIRLALFAVALLLGVSACFSLLISGWKNRTLAFIGLYSYAIYLFHVFFTASTRMFLYSMNVRNVGALIAVATTAGVVGPILIEKIAGRFALTRLLLLGETGPSASSPIETHVSA